MYSITVGNVDLSFESALISVPRDGSDHDWLCNAWVDTCQDIDVIQANGYATVLGLTGWATEKGPHVVRLVEPLTDTEQAVVDYYVRLAFAVKVPREATLSAIQTVSYSWGKLISLNWGALGYAPGGCEYCILPFDSFAICLGHLRLDWAKVKVNTKA
jgi:hypothetical protein